VKPVILRIGLCNLGVKSLNYNIHVHMDNISLVSSDVPTLVKGVILSCRKAGSG
jgi:hypothetical protein